MYFTIRCCFVFFLSSVKPSATLIDRETLQVVDHILQRISNIEEVHIINAKFVPKIVLKPQMNREHIARSLMQSVAQNPSHSLDSPRAEASTSSHQVVPAQIPKHLVLVATTDNGQPSEARTNFDRSNLFFETNNSWPPPRHLNNGFLLIPEHDSNVTSSSLTRSKYDTDSSRNNVSRQNVNSLNRESHSWNRNKTPKFTSRPEEKPLDIFFGRPLFARLESSANGQNFAYPHPMKRLYNFVKG